MPRGLRPSGRPPPPIPMASGVAPRVDLSIPTPSKASGLPSSNRSEAEIAQKNREDHVKRSATGRDAQWEPRVGSVDIRGEPVRRNIAPPLSRPEGSLGTAYRAGVTMSCRETARVTRDRQSNSAIIRTARQDSLKEGAGRATAILYYIIKRVA